MSFSGWKTDSLSSITTLISRGITPKYTESFEESIIVLNQRCVRDGTIYFENARRNDLSKRKVSYEKTVQSYDVLVNSTGVGTLGRVSQIDRVKELITVDSHVTIVRADTQKVDAVFLGYAVKSNQTKIENMAEGSTGQTELSRNRLGKDLKIKYPENMEEQKSIAHILSALDEKIEVNNQINKTLENMAQEIFKRWFVDFEFPKVDGEPYKSSGGEMVESELGMIPKGWEVKSVFELVDSISVKHSFPNDKIVFLNTSDIFNGEVLLHEERIVEDLPGQAKKSVKKHDILYSEIRPENKRFAYVNFDSENYVVSTKLMVLRSKIISSAIVYFLLTCENTINELQMMAESRSGTFPQITFDNMKYIKIALPIKRTFLDNISKNFDVIINVISEKRKENISLKDIRDSLLPKLMSGEIRVPILRR